jgi:hypothetical protein
MPPVEVSLFDSINGEPVGKRPVQPGDDGDRRAELPPQVPGVYQLIVDTPGVAPVRDVISVAEETP